LVDIGLFQNPLRDSVQPGNPDRIGFKTADVDRKGVQDAPLDRNPPDNLHDADRSASLHQYDGMIDVRQPDFNFGRREHIYAPRV
jgi:hypothetical protein